MRLKRDCFTIYAGTHKQCRSKGKIIGGGGGGGVGGGGGGGGGGGVAHERWIEARATRGVWERAPENFEI